MILKIANPAGKDYREISRNPSSEVIHDSILSMPWKNISAAMLIVDSKRWIELSGSKEDGFSIVYSDEKDEWITIEPPETMDEGIEALQSYASGGGEWFDSYQWSRFNKSGSTGPNAKGGCASIIALTLLLGAALWYSNSSKEDANQALEAMPFTLRSTGFAST